MYLRLNLLLIVTLFLFAHGSMPRPVHDNFGEVGPAAGAGEGAGGSESLPLTDPRKNLTIFDWDDTLLPTTFMTKIHGHYEIPIRFQLYPFLEKIERYVIRLIRLALNFGQVIIITNGSFEWFTQSVSEYFPNLKNFIEDYNHDNKGESNNKQIRVIPTYGTAYVREGARKMHSLYKILTDDPNYKYRPDISIYNIISVGDSNEERQMVHNIRQYFAVPDSEIISKSVKLEYRTRSIHVLLAQIELLIEEFDAIASSKISGDYTYSEFGFEYIEVPEAGDLVYFGPEISDLEEAKVKNFPLKLLEEEKLIPINRIETPVLSAGVRRRISYD